MVKSELKYRPLVKYLMKDDEQLESLKILSKKREISIKHLVKRGIFCVPEIGELDYLLEEWDLDFEDVFGKDSSYINLVNEGFIIPALDSRFNIIFYINYNWERGGARKYLNVFPDEFNDLPINMKMFGMHNMEKGIKEGWIVVVEGIFDVIRLESYGIPAVALMSNKVMDYHKRFLSRFNRVIYVSDADEQGQRGKNKVLKSIPNAIHFPIEGLSKDVDDFSVEDPIGFDGWIEKLKIYKDRGN